MRLRDDEVVRVGSTAVRNDGDVVRGRHRADLEQLETGLASGLHGKLNRVESHLGHSSHPHAIGLDDVDRSALDELAEAVLGV
mgnify:FL=1